MSKKMRILQYGESIIGTSHEERGICCQDACGMIQLQNDWVCAAIADGVGSAKFSDKASKLAIKTVMEYISSVVSKKTLLDEMKDALKVAYQKAMDEIQDLADSEENSISEYDTTLSTVIYDGKNIVYAHSGDGGIVGLTTSGEYIKITSPQKAEDGICVIPLRAGEISWQIQGDDKEYASILLSTDGIYDTFFPYLLKGQPNEVYVPLIRYFMDNSIMNVNEKNFEEIKNSRIDFIKSDVYKSVTDDKTLVVLINPNIIPQTMSEEYYQEPDWNALQLEWNKKAYPHLYKEGK